MSRVWPKPARHAVLRANSCGIGFTKTASLGISLFLGLTRKPSVAAMRDSEIGSKAATRRRLLRAVALVLIAGLAWVVWRMSLAPSPQAQTAPRAGSPPAPQSRLQEDVQMARAYLRDALPRSGPYRYDSADDYLWVETRDCGPALDGLLEMAHAGHDPGRSAQAAVAYAALGSKTSRWETAQMLQTAQRWPQSKELAWMAASQCNAVSHCPQAGDTAQRLAALDPDNVLAWLPLLELAFHSAQQELFRLALDGAQDAQAHRAYAPAVVDSLQAALAPVQPPMAACALEFERRSLSHGVPYDADTWRATARLAMQMHLDPNNFYDWSVWCMPGEFPQADRGIRNACLAVLQRLEAGDATLNGKPRLQQILLKLTEGTAEHAAWQEKMRALAWLDAFDARHNTFAEQHDAGGNLVRASFRADPRAGNTRYALLERQARAQGAWPPPADFPMRVSRYAKPVPPGTARRMQERWRARRAQLAAAH